MTLSPHQEIGTDDVVEANRASGSIEAEEQRKVVEATAELLGGEGVQSPELFEDRERNVFIFREDRELLELAYLFSGQPPETRSDRSGDGLTT
jgi:hypothetical protein